MEELAKWFGSNPWGINTLALLTVGGILLGGWGIFLAYKSRKEKEPCYAMKTFTLIRDSLNQIPDVEVLYKGHEQSVTNLTISRVLIWNEGRDPIRKEDVIQSNPPRLTVADACIILDAKVKKQNTEDNHFQVTVSGDKKAAIVTFNHIDQNDAAEIEVVHTGPSEDSISMQGRIIGGGQFKRVFARTWRPPHPSGWMKGLPGLIFLPALPFVGIALAFNSDSNIAEKIAGWTMFALFIIFVGFFLRIARKNTPKGFESF